MRRVRYCTCRVHVPLDGSDRAASIIPDAVRLAGSEGELVLMRVVGLGGVHDEYPGGVAQPLETKGVSVQSHTLINDDVAQAIDTAISAFEIVMIACVTHR
jgi:hypothetical protein